MDKSKLQPPCHGKASKKGRLTLQKALATKKSKFKHSKPRFAFEQIVPENVMYYKLLQNMIDCIYIYAHVESPRHHLTFCEMKSWRYMNHLIVDAVMMFEVRYC